VVLAARLAVERGRADQNARGVAGGLRVAQLVAHVDQDLARIGTPAGKFYADLAKDLDAIEPEKIG